MNTNNDKQEPSAETPTVEPTTDLSEEEQLAKLEEETNLEVAKLTEGEENPSSSESAPDKSQTPSKEGETESEQDSEADGESATDNPDSESEDNSKEVKKKTLSNKAQKRFKKLSEKANKAEIFERENQELKRQLAERREYKTPDLTLNDPSKSSAKDPQTGLPWDRPQSGVDEGANQNQQDPAEVARQVTRQEIALQRWHDDFVSDVKSIEKNYPELNEDHASYDQKLTDKVASLYQQSALVKVVVDGKEVFRPKPGSPTFREFTDDFMSLLTRSAKTERSRVTTKVLKQASKQAIVPSGSVTTLSGSVEDQIKNAGTLEEAEALANQALRS